MISDSQSLRNEIKTEREREAERQRERKKFPFSINVGRLDLPKSSLRRNYIKEKSSDSVMWRRCPHLFIVFILYLWLSINTLSGVCIPPPQKKVLLKVPYLQPLLIQYKNQGTKKLPFLSSLYSLLFFFIVLLYIYRPNFR